MTFQSKIVYVKQLETKGYMHSTSFAKKKTPKIRFLREVHPLN
jgi:hypothetical protein